MIAVDKMRSAYATTPLCQHEWTKKDGNNPTMLCAISALVSFAGVQPDLIHKMNTTLSAKDFLEHFTFPVLKAEYGLPSSVFSEIVRLFDAADNEWRGVQSVLDYCETYNMLASHDEAIAEDCERFPQVGPFKHTAKSFVSGYMAQLFALQPLLPNETAWLAANWPSKILDNASSHPLVAVGAGVVDDYWTLTNSKELVTSPKYTGWKPSPLFLVPAPKSKDWVFFGVSAVEG